MLVTGSLVLAFVVVLPASAEPEACPPVCDQIPNTAWIGQRAVPLNSVYNWPALAGLAVQVTGSGPRSRFEELCGARQVPQDPRAWAVGARATVVHPDGQWQLQSQILHWRGDTAHGGAIAASVFSNGVESDGRGDQRAGAHAQLPGRASSQQHDQRADAVVVGAAASGLAIDGGQSGAGRDDRAIVRCLYRLVSVSRRWQLPPVELAPGRI
jgi:hypothetical protein